MQSITITAGVFSVGFLGCCIVRPPLATSSNTTRIDTLTIYRSLFFVQQVVLPAYPSYNANPVSWLPPLTEDGKVKALEEKSS